MSGADRTSERRPGNSRLHGRPLDEDGNIELTIERGASEGANEPPPLPAPHVEVLRWHDGYRWRAVDARGNEWMRAEIGPASWLNSTSYGVRHAARRRLAEALAAERAARAAQIEAAYRDGYAGGWIDHRGGEYAFADDRLSWENSRTRAALGEGAK